MKTPVRAVPKPKTPTPTHAPKDILTYFPPQFTPRPQQVDAIRKIDAAFKAGKRVVVLEMPTGGGKSFLTQTFARAMRAEGKRTHFITSSKILQDQYTHDFPSPEIELVKGRNAYPCNHPEAAPGDTAALAPCTRKGKSLIAQCCTDGGVDPDAVRRVKSLDVQPDATTCPFWHQLLKAAHNPITLYNFSSFLYQQRMGRFGKRDLLVVDEAHNIESQLLNFVELTITQSSLDPIDLTLPMNFQTAEDVRTWVKTVALKPVSVAMRDETLPFNEQERLYRLFLKLQLFMEYTSRTEWLLEYRVDADEDTGEDKKAHAKRGKPAGPTRPNAVVCRPVYAFDFADELLFRKADKALCVSATILDVRIWAANLGLPENEVAFIQMDSDFPVANRPIIREYVGDMSYKHKDITIPRLVRWVRDVLLPRHQNERGIIHAQSFALAQAIVQGVRSPRLLLHAPGQDKRDVLRAHANRMDSVIVAPAFHEGIDLRDDLSRFQVLAKAPYPSLADPVIKRRMETGAGQAWYGWLSALRAVQSYGRSVRSKDDHAITYLTDAGFEGLLTRNRRMFPRWFMEALQPVKWA